MAEEETSLYLIVIVALVAVLGLGLSVASFATHQSMGGMLGGTGSSMMGGAGATTPASTQPGAFEWSVLILSAVFLAAALFLVVRMRATRSPAPTGSPDPSAPAPMVPLTPPSIVPAAPANEPQVTAAPPAPSVAEPTLVKLLDGDERRMYLELRDHGGQMYQRDLVALRIFSKAKVTRVLDKLESKGLVVREAHGMTNRVRLVHLPAR